MEVNIEFVVTVIMLSTYFVVCLGIIFCACTPKKKSTCLQDEIQHNKNNDPLVKGTELLNFSHETYLLYIVRYKISKCKN